MAAKKSAPKRGATRGKKAPAKRPAGRRRKGDNRAGRQIAALCIIVAGVLILLGLVFDSTGLFGSFFKNLLLGLFGGGAYPFPLVLIFGGVFLAVGRERKGSLVKLYAALALQLLIPTILQIFHPLPASADFGGFLSELYRLGQQCASGGVVGGLIGAGLLKLFDVVGSVIVLVVLCLVDLILLSGLTLERITDFFFPKEGDEPEELEEPERPRRAAEPDFAPVRLTRGKKKPRIDIPLDGRKKRPRPAPVEDDVAPFPLADEPHPAEPEPVTPEPAEKQPEAEYDALFARALEPKEPKITKEEIKGEEMKIADELSRAAESERPVYLYPSTDLLCKDTSGGDRGSADELRANATKIVETLKSFGVETKIINVAKGPAVTRYELQPSVGVKISKITSLADDIALSLAAVGVRIEAPIPGKAAVGIEVPNKKVNTVYIRDLLESATFKNAQSKLTFAIGEDLAGQDIVGDIGKMPHMLIAGATGSGKSVCINTLITSLLYKASPEEVRLVMVDPKVVELGVYNGIPHLLIPVVTEPKKAAGALNWSLGEMERRYKLFAEKGVRDLKGYNQLAVGDEELSTMPHIVIIIDELADLMMTSPKDVEDAICRLAQKARAAGMHLVIATQRPSVDVITGTIKANIPSRIAFAVSSAVDSRTILDMGGAEKLLGKGDMLYYPVGAAKPIRVQGCFVSDGEVENVVGFVKASAGAEYDQTVIDSINASAEKGSGAAASSGDGEEDEMLDAAIDVVVDSGMASTSMLQRRLKLGYARASRLIDEMEARGIVGPFEGSKPRTVKITKDQWAEMRMRKLDEQG